MRELLTMWRHRQMVVNAVVVAVAYVLVLVPFKNVALVPGFATVRPASALPVAFALLFGPAAAWGAAVGNLIGDLLGGTFNSASGFGFAGNFLFAVAAYKLWGNLGPLSTGDPPDMAAAEQFTEYVLVGLVSSCVVAVVIAWGTEVVGVFPFSVLAMAVAVNNAVAVLVIGPPLLYFAYPRLADAGWLFTQVMPGDGSGSARSGQAAAAVVAAVTVVWLVVGVTLSVGVQGVPLWALPMDVFGQGGWTVQVVLGTVAVVLQVGALLFVPSRVGLTGGTGDPG